MESAGTETAVIPATEVVKREQNHRVHIMSIDVPDPSATATATASATVPNNESSQAQAQPPLHDNCNAEAYTSDSHILSATTKRLAGQTIAPFLAKHIPEQYAPLGPQSTSSATAATSETTSDNNTLTMTIAPPETNTKPTSTKYCYRHRPDSLCRRTADEPTMENLQRDLQSLSQADQQGISHAWSLFSAAPAKHRNLILQGILTQCCFPQLSYLSAAVRDLIRIDFISALPSEISYKILCYLDTTSLCKAAQVSQKWRNMADDDVVWHRMCEQHIDRKCERCGWGLPLLERKRLRDWKRQQQLRGMGRNLNEWSPNLTPLPEDSRDRRPSPTRAVSAKRAAPSSSSQNPDVTSAAPAKRLCVNGGAAATTTATTAATATEPSYFDKPLTRPWKDVYKDRFKVGTNWKHGRYSTRVFRGHENGVMCLQIDENILATGSYDCTIKIWDLTTGTCLRTLRGHTLGIRALQFDDNKLISGSLDKTLKVWNWRTGECISTYQGHTEGVVAVNFDGNVLASGSIDRTIKIWNFSDKSTFSLRGHKDWVNAVRVDAASRTVFSASDDCTVRLWDLDLRQKLRVYRGHVGQVQQLVLMPVDYEPDHLTSDAEEDGTGSSNASFSDDDGDGDGDDDDGDDDAEAEAGAGNPVSSSPSWPNPPPDTDPQHSTYSSWPPSRPHPPRYMMTSALDGTIRLWDVETGRCLKTLFGHVEGVWALAADTLRVASGAEDRMVKVWDARTGKYEKTFTGHEGPVTCLGLSDSRVVTGSEDHTVRVLSFKSE